MAGKGRGLWAHLISDAEYMAKIRSKCVETAGGCWEWQGPQHTKGYGLMSYRNKQSRVHRVTYTIAVGAIPAGQMVCHTCDNRTCCNPAHLFLGDAGDNVRDCAAKGRLKQQTKTHCLRGHELSAENIYSDGGKRKCKVCMRIRGRLYAGWPKDLAETMGPTPKGHRPVGGKFPRRRNASPNAGTPHDP